MASTLKNLWGRVASHGGSAQDHDGVSKPPNAENLFPVTDPAVDGEECLRDCDSCTIKYPRKWSIDEDDNVYGNIGGWETHLIVATGKTDWVRDVADEKGSIMQAVENCGVKPSNGKMMLSASDMPLPHEAHNTAAAEGAETPTTVLLLPAFTLVDNVTPSSVPDLIQNHISTGPTNTQALGSDTPRPTTSTKSHESHKSSASSAPKPTLPLVVRDCPHNYLILLCSHKTRDARCGQSAPLLRREFERHLRPLGLYRDLHDERPGGVGIYFINHVGGHKYAANVLIYRRAGSAGTAAELVATAQEQQQNGAGTEAEKEGNGTAKENREAAQCMWLARVRPEDCENIVKFTILQGKLLKPERQLRGGFDRGRQLTSW